MFILSVSYFGLASGAAGVEDEQRVLCVQPLGFTLFRRGSHYLIPPNITSRVPGGLNKPERGANETLRHLIMTTHSVGQETTGSKHTVSVPKKM